MSLREKGIRRTVSAICRHVIRPVCHYVSFTRGSATFLFRGKHYRYFYHEYNLTWRNERTVEVPIVWEIVRSHEGKAILEVGNVLSHYFSVRHDIVDKYEKAAGVISTDIVNYFPKKKYDLIVSISTLEHVGWDEDRHDPTKILRTIRHLKNLLSPQGKM